MRAKTALLVGMLAISSAAIIFRYTSAPPLAVAAYRLGISFMLMLALTREKVQDLFHLSNRERFLLLVSGFFLALHFSAWFYSLRYTTVAASTIIVTSSPIIVLIVSWILLKERPTIWGAIGTGVSFAGILVVFSGHTAGRFLGDLYAFFAMLATVIYLMAGRILRKKVETLPYVTAVYGLSAIFLLMFALLKGDPLIGYPAREYMLFLLLALIPSGIGHTLYNYSLKFFKTYLVSLTILGEPLIASILAIPLFGELPKINTVFGGIMIGLGMYMALKSEGMSIRS